jgi:uncharacterized protein
MPVHYPGKALIEAYGSGGFRFAGMSHRGSILVLPSGIYGWDVSAVDEFNVESFARVFTERAAIGFLLLGTGRIQRLPALPIRKAFADQGMGLEAMDTGAAVRTYNVLLAEDRPVAAALIAVGGES